MSQIEKLRNLLSYQIAVYPRLFVPIYKYFVLQDNDEALVAHDTEIVIEGFPRSGNTFAFVAFQHAQPKRVKIAHHLHAEAQILEGIRLGIPVLVLIRRPGEVIRSLLIRHPEIEAKFAIKRYIRFYSVVFQVRDHVVVGDFNKVISDYGQVIRNVNDKFGTNFSLFEHTDQNVESVFREIEAINLHFDQGRESHVARPSIYRNAEYEKSEVPLHQPLRERATSIYRTLISPLEL